MPRGASRPVVDWLLAGEALAGLALAFLALRAVPFARLAAWASRRRRRAAEADRGEAARVGWAVAAAARRAPWPTTCFARGLACHAMLRRRGLASQLCYGARNQGPLGPEAHVWVRSGDIDVVGGAPAAQFALLAAFPPMQD